MAVTSLTPLVRPIAYELNMNYTEMGRVLGTWQLVYIATALPCGAMIDRLGLRRSLFIASVLVGFSCVIERFCSGPTHTFIGRGFFWIRWTTNFSNST